MTEERDANDTGPRRPAQRHRPGRGRHATAARAQNTRNAGRWVLAIAILQILFGVGFGLSQSKEADRQLHRLVDMPDTAVSKYRDGRATVAEIRTDIEKARLLAFVVPIGLGVVFLGLYAWSRKSAVPAIGTALGLYVASQAVEAVIEPASLAEGVILKVICILALVRGLESAIQQRSIAAAEAAEAEAAAAAR